MPYMQQLQETLQKEVNLMRELLANMHQEELSRLLCDEGSLHELLEQRLKIFDRLECVSIMRKELENKTDIPSEEISAEVISLRDQLLALAVHTNRQKTHNQYLKDHPEYMASYHSQPTRNKKKTAIATYQIKDRNKPHFNF